MFTANSWFDFFSPFPWLQCSPEHGTQRRVPTCYLHFTLWRWRLCASQTLKGKKFPDEVLLGESNHHQINQTSIWSYYVLKGPGRGQIKGKGWGRGETIINPVTHSNVLTPPLDAWKAVWEINFFSRTFETWCYGQHCGDSFEAINTLSAIRLRDLITWLQNSYKLGKTKIKLRRGFALAVPKRLKGVRSGPKPVQR